MTAAIALAVVLVIAVAGASMAFESQKTGQSPARRVPRVPGPAAGRRARDRTRRSPDPTGSDGPPSNPPDVPEPEFKAPDLSRMGVQAEAKVISVVDVRTIGPVTRSRLALRIEPEEGAPFEVTVRVAFQTPESRARVRVGGTVPVRYDRDDHSRVVVDLPQE